MQINSLLLSSVFKTVGCSDSGFPTFVLVHATRVGDIRYLYTLRICLKPKDYYATHGYGLPGYAGDGDHWEIA